MTEKEEEQLQSSNTCCICEKRIEYEKVRDHCHITVKFIGAAHWSCNINLQLIKIVPVIFHNLRGYDSHLVFYKFKNFDVKIYAIPNGLQKYMVFMINENLLTVCNFLKTCQTMISNVYSKNVF